MKPIIKGCIPLYGADARFRFYLRLRELFRKYNMKFWGGCLKVHLQKVYGCELSFNARISPKSSFMYTVGVVIGEGVIIEEGVIIYSGVVLGRKDIYADDDYPIIEKNVVLSANCSVLGKCVVHEGAVIGAHSLVIKDCEPNGTYVGIPAERVK